MLKPFSHPCEDQPYPLLDPPITNDSGLKHTNNQSDGEDEYDPNHSRDENFGVTSKVSSFGNL